MTNYPPEPGIPGEPPGPYSADDHLEELTGALEAQLVPDWCEADAVGMPDQCCGAPGHCLSDPKVDTEQVLEDLATLNADLRAEVLNGLMQQDD
jgi:hypothetical protein